MLVLEEDGAAGHRGLDALGQGLELLQVGVRDLGARLHQHVEVVERLAGPLGQRGAPGLGGGAGLGPGEVLVLPGDDGVVRAQRGALREQVVGDEPVALAGGPGEGRAGRVERRELRLVHHLALPVGLADLVEQQDRLVAALDRDELVLQGLDVALHDGEPLVALEVLEPGLHLGQRLLDAPDGLGV